MAEFTHELENLLPEDLYPDYGPENTTKQPVTRKAVKGYLNGPYANPNNRFAAVGVPAYGYEVTGYWVPSSTDVFLGMVNRGVYLPPCNAKGTGVFLPRTNGAIAAKKTAHRPKIEEEVEKQMARNPEPKLVRSK